MNRFSGHDRIGRRLARCVAGILSLFAMIGIAEPALAENTVTRWAEQSLQAVRAANVGTPNAGRLYAMVNVAMYDAVNGIDAARHRFGREHALVPTVGAPRAGSRNAAAAAAAHAVLVALVPSQQAALDAALAADLAAAQDGDLVAGEIWGRYVGEQVVTLRATDGTAMALTIPAGTAVGEHRAAFDARFRNMTPFGVRNIDRYRSGPPPALTSEAYAQAFNDVKTLGQQDADAERNAIAQFWLVEGGTTREPGTWIQALVAIVEQMRTDRSLSDTARIFARVGMAIADGVAASWDTKATFFTWRPFFAIREADLDGNPDTDADPAWTPRNHLDRRFSGVDVGPVHVLGRRLRGDRSVLFPPPGVVLLCDRSRARAALLQQPPRSRHRGWPVANLSGHSLSVLERGGPPGRPAHRPRGRSHSPPPLFRPYAQICLP